MIQASKIIGTGLATMGLIGAGIGIGAVFGALILGFSLIEAAGLFALMNNLVDFICGLFTSSKQWFHCSLILPIVPGSNRGLLNANFVTGFIDGEGCFTFYVRLRKNSKCKIG